MKNKEMMFEKHGMQNKETSIQDDKKQWKELKRNKCLLTVVIPSYNAFATLNRTVQSFLKSRYAHEGIFEVLLVDDGSTDDTGKLIDQYVIAHPTTLRAIHKENGGHGSCINTGIREAYGEYLKVVDADDWVEPEEFDKLLEALNQQNTDIVSSQYMWAFEKSGFGKTAKGNIINAEKDFRYQKEFTEPFKGVQYGKTYIWKDIPTTTYIKMHAMTIRTAILRENNIHIDEHSFYVDTEFILFPVPYVRTISFTEANVYRYRIGRKGQSMSPEKMRKNAEQYAHVMESLLEFYRTMQHNKDANQNYAYFPYLEHAIARIYAGWVKILLSFPASQTSKRRLMNSERKLRLSTLQISIKPSQHFELHIISFTVPLQNF